MDTILDNIIFLDLETTGLHPEKDEIIEIGAVKIKSGTVTEYRQLLNPPCSHISPVIFNLCEGLTKKQLREAPVFAQVESGFREFIEDYPIACHNAGFDSSFLVKAMGGKINNAFLDTLELFCLFKPQFRGHGINYITENYLGRPCTKKHRALEDARDTMDAATKLFEDLCDRDNDLLRKTVESLKGEPQWPWLKYLLKVPYKLGVETLPPLPGRDGRKTIKSKYFVKDIKKILPDEKIWDKQFPDYSFKEHQLALAENIIKSFGNGEALFTEAPTGSGKTLAYLLVALLWSLEKGERVFISTNTKNLQQQIDRDLPRLCAVLGISGFKHMEMKGIGNYACKNKIMKELGEPSRDFDDRMARIYLHNWMQRTGNGETEEFSYWFRRKNKKIAILGKTVCCGKEDCHGSDCEHEKTCFYRKKVAELHESSICTINHSLLLTWPQSYPPVKKLVIDEAHALEDNCFAGFTEEVDSVELKGLLYRLYRGKTDGYLHFLLFRLKKNSPGANFEKAFKMVASMKEYVDRISGELELISMGDDTGYSFREEISAEWAELKTLVTGCANTMEKLASYLEDTLREASLMDDTFEDSPICRQGTAHYKGLRGWSKVLAGCMDESDTGNCRYVEYHHQSGNWSFRVTPLDVSEHFYLKVLQDIDSVVLTSATLSEKRRYDRLVECLGFDRLEEGRVRQLEPLEHLFDYENNSVLAIPGDSYQYDEEEFTGYMAGAILKAASVIGGRTLVLFTNLQRMKQVIEHVKLPLEKQGISPYYIDGTSRQGLIDMFREDRNSVLFGSKAFFEGIDVKGPGLSCIIIDKLPYPFPADPLYNARSRYLASVNKNAFKELSLSSVIRTFRQQFGRLIRSAEDRGFVLVLSQLDYDRNGKIIISEIPPARVIKAPLDEIIETMHRQFSDWGYKVYNVIDDN